MGLYVDSALLDEVASLAASYPLAGVTTNPTILLAARERGYALTTEAILRELLTRCPGDVFAQPTADTTSDIRSEAERYLALDPRRIVLKLPMSEAGLAAARTLITQGARIAFTAVFTAEQAYCGVLAGAAWVIPYFGRLRRSGIDPCQRIEQMARVIAAQGDSTRLLCASLRTPDDALEALLAGAHDLTVTPEVVRQLVTSPLTDAALTQFAQDAEKLRATVPTATDVDADANAAGQPTP